MKKTVILKNIVFIVLVGLFFCLGCQKKNNSEAKFVEYVFGVQLVNDSTMVEKYLEYHKNVWPEVEQGFRKAGYERIGLFRFENYITMIIEVPSGSNLAEMGKVCNNSNKRVDEWNKLMNTFQRGLPGTEEGQTWVEMKKIYEFNNTD